MTAMLHETMTAWKKVITEGDTAGRLLILWMLVLAPALVVYSTFRAEF